MKTAPLAFALVVLAAAVVGCWVALPSNGPDNSRLDVGKEYTLVRDIFVVEGSGHSWAAEIEAGKGLMSVREPKTKLKKGNRIRIDSIVSRREELGVFYYYRCKNLDGIE